jgi:hypothetical protein
MAMPPVDFQREEPNADIMRRVRCRPARPSAAPTRPGRARNAADHYSIGSNTVFGAMLQVFDFASASSENRVPLSGPML